LGFFAYKTLDGNAKMCINSKNDMHINYNGKTFPGKKKKEQTLEDVNE